MERLQSASASFLQGILSILKSNAVKGTYSTDIRIDHDIIRYGFNGKGKKTADGAAMLYGKNYFTRFELPPYWYYYLNQLGEGIAVDFPVKVKTVLTYSRKRHMFTSIMQIAPNFPVEKIVIYVNRKACNYTKI